MSKIGTPYTFFSLLTLLGPSCYYRRIIACQSENETAHVQRCQLGSVSKLYLTCSHSNKEVAKANFDVHEPHCQRFLCLCPDCDETIHRDQLEDHKAEQHAEVITLWSLFCAKKVFILVILVSLQCLWCCVFSSCLTGEMSEMQKKDGTKGSAGPRGKLLTSHLTEHHTLELSFLKKACQYCSILCLWSHPLHASSHLFPSLGVYFLSVFPFQTDECPERLKSCEYCELELPWSSLLKHSLSCGSRTELCSDCGRYVQFKHQQKHALECSNTPPTVKNPEDDEDVG